MESRQMERLTCLDILIRDNRYPSSQTIHKYFKVSRRTAYRDIQILKNQFKAPLAYDPSKRGYYYTREGWSLSAAADSWAQLLVSRLGLDTSGIKLHSKHHTIRDT